MSDTDKNASPPATPRADAGDGNMQEEAVMLGWASLDGLVSAALVTLAVSLLPASHADTAGTRIHTGDGSTVGFALLLALPVFLIINGMRRSFLSNAIGRRHARALDQIALGSSAAVLVMAIGYAHYGDGHLWMLLPLYLPAVMVPSVLLILGLYFCAKREEARWARELATNDARSEDDLANDARAASRAWIIVALMTAAASSALGISTLVPSHAGAAASKEAAHVHRPVHAVTAPDKEA
ncbi:hypothetical protein Q2B95_15520 [Stenotrophomonas maltophilia]|uniref:hypothetical protein n=1 Tax=Stenotrophomonas maltophilia TaxID=40324 RepID=UPI00309670AD